MYDLRRQQDAATPTLKSVVALLKLADWDPDVFYKFRDTILNQVSTAVTKLKKDLCRGIPRVWSNYYMLDKDKVNKSGRYFPRCGPKIFCVAPLL